MTVRATYVKLISPIAQIQAAEDFVGQMEAMVADTWRDRDDPAANARAASESSAEFLEELHDEGFTVPVLRALKKHGLRFESDGDETDDGTGGCDGYFRCRRGLSSLDCILDHMAAKFSVQVIEFAPDGWVWEDTTECLGWENLVLVPDQEGAVTQALWLLDGQFREQSEAPRNKSS